MIFQRTVLRSFHTRSRLLNSHDHDDIPSFLEYASRVSLPHNRTTFQGTLYEYTVLKALSDLSPSFNLSRVGGRGDLGIDLFGEWALPQPPINVVVQCKFYKTEGPSAVRDLIGAIVSRAGNPYQQRVLGILAGRGNFTAGIRNALVASRLPLAFLKVTPAVLNDARDGQCGGGMIQQFVWNRAAASTLLAGFSVTGVYGEKNEHVLESTDAEQERQEGQGREEGQEAQKAQEEQEPEFTKLPDRVILTFNGRPLEHDLPILGKPS